MTIARILLADAPDPLDALERVALLRRPVLLDGAAERDGLGRWSFLSADPVELLEGSADDWPRIRDAIRASVHAETHDPSGPPLQGGWIGWLGYELGRAFDRQPIAAAPSSALPDISLGRYDWCVAWDHASGAAWLVAENAEIAAARLAMLEIRDSRLAIRDLTAVTRADSDAQSGPRNLDSRIANRESPASDFTADEYRAAVQSVIDHVLAGDIFQANLSQQWRRPFGGDPLRAYRELRHRAPGSHAAFLDTGRAQLLSMSPELFLRYTPADRRLETRPIKGTRPRDDDPTLDAALAGELLTSEKDRAENVMIVDLLRNDLNRVAVPGSVVVPSLCRLESYAAVHHLVSIVTGTLGEGCDALDAIAAMFPGGSITGAPKLRAMEIIAGLERHRRGPYCGAIGWIGRDGAVEFNVAIRTVTLADGEAIVPAGGGITALSDPEAEHRETVTKAAALLAALEAAG